MGLLFRRRVGGEQGETRAQQHSYATLRNHVYHPLLAHTDAANHVQRRREAALIQVTNNYRVGRRHATSTSPHKLLR